MQTNRSFFTAFVFIAATTIIWPNRAGAQTTAEARPPVCSRPLSLIESRGAYRPFNDDEIVKSSDGYGIYSVLPIQLDGFDVDNNGSVSTIFRMGYGSQHAKLVSSALGTWVSIRREFTRILDLSGSTGIEISIYMVKPAQHATLRVTVSDVADLSDFGAHGRDRTWIYTFKKKVTRSAGETQTLRAPWIEFKKPEIFGTRMSRSNIELQADKIIAYEIGFLGSRTVETRIVAVKCY